MQSARRPWSNWRAPGPVLAQAYRGSGAARPAHLPLPPAPLPLVYGGRLRKVWRYVSIWCPELLICAARVSVGPVRQEFWAVWDRSSRRLWEHTRRWPGRVQLPPGTLMVRDGDVTIDVALEDGVALEVVSPSGRAYTWTRKQIGRAHGRVTLNGRTQPLEAVALIDDNAGYHPRHTWWQWCGGAGHDQYGRTVAWSVIVGLNDAPIHSERTLWIDGVAQEVGPVRFSTDLTAVAFTDGGVLCFAAEAVRQRRDNLVVLRSAYCQPFGRFAGTLPGGLRVLDAYGVMEQHRALW